MEVMELRDPSTELACGLPTAGVLAVLLSVRPNGFAVSKKFISHLSQLQGYCQWVWPVQRLENTS